MEFRRIGGVFRFCVLVHLAILVLAASEQRGQVTFDGLPVPGATVTAVQDTKKFSAITDQQGWYSLADLPEGIWRMDVQMFGFEKVVREVAIGHDASAVNWELKLLPLDRISAEIQRPVEPPQENPPAVKESSNTQVPAARAPEEDELIQRAADGLLINGSINNGAASVFGQAAAFGNNRIGGKSLYNGGIGLIFDNSALDARPFSLTGQDTPKAAYNRLTGVVTLGGPLQIPHLFKNGPIFFAGYQWTRNNDVSSGSALMPDLAQRIGAFPNSVLDPLTGAPFPGNVIPQNRISPQARSLLSLYPLPNFGGKTVNPNAQYNYQIPLVSSTHQDALQSRFDKPINTKNQIYGRFAFQSTRTAIPNLFGLLDTTDVLGLNTSVNWTHRINQRWFQNVGYQFSRLATRVTPYFENRENVSARAGVSGNNQDPTNWGPPSLVFSSGIAGLNDSQSSFDRDQTHGLSYSIQRNGSAHNVTFGGDFRRQEYNYLSQQDPRGTFTFTGAATGSAFADFLIGIPDTSSVAFGNADKYFRESVYDAFVTDDWRVSPELTINAGARWEYGSPITERYDRLVNLDIVSNFGAATPVLASQPLGALTGQRYPGSLVRSDKLGLEPRVGIAWRPVSGSSMVVRAGYGVYRDTPVYLTIAQEMAQQAPLSKSLQVQNSAAHPLTLANGFNTPPSGIANTFAIDPNFRVGYAQNWQLSIQRDLPGSLQMTATYIGIKGTRGVQDFLPNTYPVGNTAANPCPACPAGFAYLTSNGNSTREAAQIQLRRRLHNGFAGILQYTFSKSIDDDAVLGGQQAVSARADAFTETGTANVSIAQNWLNLSAERGLSSFDQRHLLSLQLRYTTGIGIAGGTLLSGWKGALLKEWTFATQITAGTGLPQTPIYLTAVEGTGVTGTIRPDYTGAKLYAAPSGLFLNPAAYTPPVAGQWGNAGRDSITGPSQFLLNASLGRTFRVSDQFNLDLRVDSTNSLNRVNFSSWNTIVNSAQFGLPASANAMRSMQTTLRLRF